MQNQSSLVKEFGWLRQHWVASSNSFHIRAQEQQTKTSVDGGSVVMSLAQSLPKHPGENYHLVFDNLFTSPQLLHNLKNAGFAATGTLRANWTMKAPLKTVPEMDKLERGAMDAVVDVAFGIHLVRWKDNKVVTVASTMAGQHPVQKCRLFSTENKERVSIPQLQSIQLYNKRMGGVDRCDQNIACYMITLHTKKWWWLHLRYCIDLGK